jgi:hypothetical protein
VSARVTPAAVAALALAGCHHAGPAAAEPPIEICANAASGALPAGPAATCEGRPLPFALRRYLRGDAVLTAGFVPQAARVVLGEPLFVTFVLRNDGPRPGGFNPNSYETATTRRPNRFQLVAVDDARATPVPDAEDSMEIDNFGVASTSLAPGQAYVQPLVLSDWALLDRPGSYTIAATRQLPGWDTTESGGVVESIFKLEVLPADAARLGAVIDALGAELRERKSERALRALLAIPDPRAVPHLAWGLDHLYAAWLVLPGLARFNTPERRRLAIAALSAPDAGVRESAAEALRGMPSEETARALQEWQSRPAPRDR